jgi:hypothetical protein
MDSLGLTADAGFAMLPSFNSIEWIPEEQGDLLFRGHGGSLSIPLNGFLEGGGVQGMAGFDPLSIPLNGF